MMMPPENEGQPGEVPFSFVGRRIPSKEAPAKATGSLPFAGDLSLPGLLHGKVLRSPHPHALIKRIKSEAARRKPWVKAVMTAADIPGTNRYGLILPDQRVLAEGKVRFRGEAVALVAAESEDAAEEALSLIRVDYRPLPGVFSPEEALKPDAPLVHEQGNLLLHTRLEKGEVEEGFQRAGATVERTYRMVPVDHAYLETESGLAAPEPSGHITIWSSTQHPFRDRRQIAPVLGMEASRIRVVQAATGGAFGGKDDITVEIFLGLLVQSTGRPVRIAFGREESLCSQTKRHAMKIRCRFGADGSGRLTAADILIYSDTGAYASLGPFVTRKATLHALGPYSCPNFRGESFCVYTNNVPAGPMRGFGVVQAAFCHESQMDLLAGELGLSPLEIRLKNALRPGDSMTTGHVLRESVGVVKTLEALRER
ncbi:MAG: xanthine dehydrogenase family protein molybdopterin-binding subunit, partial [Nitrospinota bacterium]